MDQTASQLQIQRNQPRSLFFVFPAKAYLLPLPRIKPRETILLGRKVLAWDNANVYPKFHGQQMPRVAISEEPGSNRYLFEIEKGGIYAGIGSAPSDDAILERLKPMGEATIERWTEDQRAILLDMDGYSKRKSEEIATRTAEHEARRAESQAKQQAEKQAKEQRELEEAEQSFASGEQVNFAQFEALCRAHGIDMPIRTIGAGRKSITAIGYGRMRLRGKSRPDMALRGYPGTQDCLKLMTTNGLPLAQHLSDILRCGSPTRRTSPTSSGRSSSR